MRCRSMTSPTRNTLSSYRPTKRYGSPKGLGVDAAAGRLFVCCKGGLKVYDLAEPGYPVWVDDLTNLPEVGSIDAYDVIPRGGLLILIGADGLYQFDYTEENLSFVSKIDLRTL